jgi:hypothetical protein
MNILLFLILVPAAVLLLRYLFVQNNLTLSRRTENVLLVVSIAAVLFSVTAEIITRYDLYFAGYRTTTYIMFSADVIVMLYYLLGTPKSRLRALQALKSIVVCAMIIHAIFITDGFTFAFRKYLIYNDGQYRIEKAHGLMAGNRIKLFVNEGIFDRYYKSEQLPYNITIDSARIQEVGNDSLYIQVFHSSKGEKNPYIIKIRL